MNSLAFAEPLPWSDIVAKQRTSKGIHYERYMQVLSQRLASNDKAVRDANAGLARLRQKDVAPTTVHQNATLTSISVQYANDEYIGLQLMPAVNVAKKSDVYYIYDKRSRLAYPDDELGPRGQANEISDARSTASYLCKPYGYENYVDGETLENQDAPLNEMVDLVEALAEGVAFREEMRIAAIVGVGTSYSGNTTAIAAADRWDTTGGGNPIKNIQDAVKGTWNGRGVSQLVGFCSYDVYLVLSRHPAILDLFKFTGTSPGLATPDMIAKFFGLDRILVGKARKDTANEGQTASYSRIWPDVFGVVRVATRPAIRTAAFGYTFRHGAPRVIQWFDQRLGAFGGYFAKNSVSEDHKIVAGDTGFLLTTVIG